MKRNAIFGMLASTTVAFACGEDSTGPIARLPRELTASETQMVAAGNQFTFELFRELIGQASGQNIVVSPTSASIALAIAYNGAAGTTADSMRLALGLGALTIEQVNASYQGLTELLLGLDRRVDVGLANSFWYRQGLHVAPEFVATSQSFYDAKVGALDFSSAEAPAIVNDWVRAQTRGMIPTIVNQLDPAVVAYLVNALYFKGIWTRQFDPSQTVARSFTLADGTSKPVPTMSKRDSVGFFENDRVIAVDLPYGGGAFTMSVLVPRVGVTVDSLAAALDKGLWLTVIGGYRKSEVDVFLPRFSLDYAIRMNQVLATLGMANAFCDGGRANFSRMSADKICVGEVRQKTHIEVDEQGTEAAAATVVSFERSLHAEARVDRPFLFAIRERFSGAILFMGRIEDPTVSSSETN